MDTDVLRWFQRVADGMTVTEVSELDGVTQSGVSRALARLESEVGTPLPRWRGRTEEIAPEPLRLALPRAHRLADRPRIRLRDVAREPFIALRPTSALR